MAASPFLINTSDDTFEAEVVQKSYEVPVIVDFWAPWCAPCRALAPALDKLATEFGGKVIVAKLNTDENPGVTGQFPIEGIPAVFAITQGKVVDSFTGLLPEKELREFFTRILPGEWDAKLKDAKQLEETDPSAAEAIYRTALAQEPSNELARVGLARVLLMSWGSEEEAASLLKPIEVGEHAAEAERLQEIIGLREIPYDDDEYQELQGLADAQPGNVAVLLKLGGALAARGDYADALSVLLSAAQEDKAAAKGPVKELMVRIFKVVGVRSELADDYRSRLQSLLY